MAFTFGPTYKNGASNFGVSTGNCGFLFHTAPLPSPKEAVWVPRTPPPFTFGPTYKDVKATNFGVSIGSCGFSFHTAPLPSPKDAVWTPFQFGQPGASYLALPVPRAGSYFQFTKVAGRNLKPPAPKKPTGFSFARCSKSVDFPEGKLCINHVNWVCKDASCSHAHRFAFSTRFSFGTSWNTIDLNAMLQVSHATGRERKIRQGSSCWEYEAETGVFREYTPADDSVIRSRLSNGGILINTKRLMAPPPGAKISWKRGSLVLQMPPHWKKRSGEAAVETVALSENDNEFLAVKLAVEKTGVEGATRVKSVTRIQNYHLMTAYLMRKHQKEAQRGGEAVEEKMLFHGTKPANVDTILNHGFDTTLSRQGGLCGAGNYFATTSSYSVPYCGGGPMFLCRVMTGKPQDKNNAVHPIRRPSEGFDSVVDNIASPQMHVVYYNSEAVPEYIVHFS